MWVAVIRTLGALYYVYQTLQKKKCKHLKELRVRLANRKGEKFSFNRNDFKIL